MGLKAGDRAPEVTLPSHENQQVPLSSLWQDGPAVLLFFPLAFSSTCTEELCTVRDDIGSYAGLNANVAAISVDSPYVLKRFREDVGADYAFLSDFNRRASEAFGVLRTAPVGPGLLNASDRAAFVIGQDGVIRYAWHETNPSLLPPFDEIKAALA
ncbi:MAG TPA: redoxin domain-containing protein [Longimicrobiaceae bacterium]|nr:redoxin domain-containing protein [Longimicrobiaceae bacterium]